jgi:signal transduction histidine kinase
MSIVKEIVELHGGHMELASKVGAGTTVTLWLSVVAESGHDAHLGAADKANERST